MTFRENNDQSYEMGRRAGQSVALKVEEHFRETLRVAAADPDDPEHEVAAPGDHLHVPASGYLLDDRMLLLVVPADHCGDRRLSGPTAGDCVRVVHRLSPHRGNAT